MIIIVQKTNLKKLKKRVAGIENDCTFAPALRNRNEIQKQTE